MILMIFKPFDKRHCSLRGQFEAGTIHGELVDRGVCWRQSSYGITARGRKGSGMVHWKSVDLMCKTWYSEISVAVHSFALAPSPIQVVLNLAKSPTGVPAACEYNQLHAEVIASIFYCTGP